MQPTRHYWRPLMAFGVLIAAMSISASPVAACTPAPIGWWFSETLAAQTGEIVPGLNVKAETVYGRAYLKFNESGVTLFRLVERADLHLGYVFPPTVHLPDGWVATSLGISVLQASNFETMVDGWKDPNRFDTLEPKRPANILVPSPQHLEPMFVYGQELISLPLTLTYILNADYHPENAYTCSPEAIAMRNLGPLCLTISIPLMILAIVSIIVRQGFLGRKVHRA